ncbi:MAG: protein kinase [Byssovorax sp.]
MEPLAPGAEIDRYRLVARLGEGGQGEVWRADDPLRPGTPIALKLVFLPGARDTAIARLRREARLLARLEHPSLPRCHAIFEDPRRDILGFALDLVDGAPLADLAPSAALGADHRLAILIHVAAALRFIHQAGLAHRDVKGANIVVADAFFTNPSDPSTVKLVDFGIATDPEQAAQLTAPGSVIGTISHLPPEALDHGFWQDKGTGPSRDMFALGVLGFELFRGQHPTGLSSEATFGDYLVAYRSQASSALAWPSCAPDDPLAPWYGRCLALHARERATSDEGLSLLREAEPRIRGTTAIASPLTITAPPRTAQQAPLPPESLSPMVPLALHVSPAPRSALVSEHTEPSRRITAPALTTPEPASWPSVQQVPLSGLVPPPPTQPRSQERRGRSSVLGWIALALGASAIILIVALVSKSGPDEEPASSPVPAFTPHAPTPLMTEPVSGPTFTPLPGAVPRPTIVVPVIVPPTCPRNMVAVPGSMHACIDRNEVTVAAYKASGLVVPTDAYWPDAGDADRQEQSEHCAGARGWSDKLPVNCVSFEEAQEYCTRKKRRLPTFDELHDAQSVIRRCDGIRSACPMYEWTSDRLVPRNHRKTLGPSFRSSNTISRNLEYARNDDLGFRCAVDLP